MLYLSVEEFLYSVYLRQLPLQPLWSLEESGVTFITVKEVTLFGLYFPQPLTRETVL